MTDRPLDSEPDPRGVGGAFRDRRAGARRTFLTLAIIVAGLFVGSLIFMVVEGARRVPEGRPVLAVFPFEEPTPSSSRYTGFGEGLASYFGRIDPRELGVLGPASTAARGEADDDPLTVGRELGADLILVGAELPRAAGPVLVVEVFRVDSGSLLWSGQFDVDGEDLRQLQARIGREVTDALNLPR